MRSAVSTDGPNTPSDAVASSRRQHLLPSLPSRMTGPRMVSQRGNPWVNLGGAMPTKPKADPGCRRVDGSEFMTALLISGFTRKRAAAALGVTRRTVRNWTRTGAAVPYSAYQLLRILSGYALPGDDWKGFTIRGELLFSPEGRSFSAPELAWWGLTCAMAREFSKRHAAASFSLVDSGASAAQKPVARTAQAASAGNPRRVRVAGAAGRPDTGVGDAGLSGGPPAIAPRERRPRRAGVSNPASA